MYEDDQAECSLPFPDLNQTWISQQILVTPLIVKFINK
jgi:hypothetical protein